MDFGTFLPSFDFGNLTFTQFIIDLFWLAILDTLAGVLAAIRTSTFTLDKIAQYLQSHVLFRVVPLGLLFFIAQQTPNSAGAVTAVAISAAAYLAETVKSLWDNLGAVQSGTVPAPAGNTP